MKQIPANIVEVFGTEDDLRKRAAAFREALAEHRLTVDTPAPVEHPVVESLAREDEDFEVVGAEVPPPSPERKPVVVTRFQIKAALFLKRHKNQPALQQVDTYMARQGGLQALAWREANEIHRYSPTVLEVAENFGWGAEEVDELFATAAAIRV